MYTTGVAYLITHTNKRIVITPEQGYKLWKTLMDPANLSEAELAKLAKVRGVWLNWQTAPPDYVEANLDSIIPLALMDWKVDSRGRPTKPDSPQAWAFAKQYKLWVSGQPTGLVTGLGAKHGRYINRSEKDG